MKRILFLLLIFMTYNALSADAQSLDGLWRQAEEAQRKDHPQTAMKLLRQIAERAEQRKDYGQILTAEFRYASCLTTVSPDSLASALNRLEQKREQCQKSNPALSAIYSTLLAHAYESNIYVDETYNDLAAQRKKDAFANVDVLARTQAKNYTPAVVTKVDSKMFNNDLLHVLAFELHEYELMRSYYETHGNRETTCLLWRYVLEAQLTANNSKAECRRQIVQIDQLIQQYADLPVAGELALYRYTLMDRLSDDYNAQQKVAYIDQNLQRWAAWKRIAELQNMRNNLTQPQYSASLSDQLYTSETPIKIWIDNLRNLNQLSVNIYRTKLNAKDTEDYYSDEQLLKLKRNSTLVPQMSASRSYSHYPEYELLSDSINLPPLPVGVYLVETLGDASGMKPQMMLLCVSNIAVLQQPLPAKQIRYVAVDARTGEPLPEATFIFGTISHHKYNRKPLTRPADRNGEVVVSQDSCRVYSVYVYTDTDRAFKNRDTYVGSPSDNKQGEVKYARIFTDRAIYRPGQTVHVGIIAFTENKDHNRQTTANQSIELQLRNANRKVVDIKNVTTDALGKASADFTLPSDGLTGNFTIRANYGNGTTTDIQVEQYKRPTFNVEFTPYTENYKAGDTITLCGQARTYSGVPVQNAQVSIEITRRENRFWWWYGSNDEVYIKTDSLLTDEQGCFKVQMPLVVPENFYDSDHRLYQFKVEANVTNMAGESHEAELTIPVSNHPTIFSVKMEEKMEHSRLHPITFNYVNAKGEPIEATVNYTIDGKPFTAPANSEVQFPWTGIPSGEHLLEATCGTDSLQMKFITFSLNDRKPVIETPDWFYLSDTQFANNDSQVTIQVGSTMPRQHIVYTIVANNTVIEKSSFRLTNANRNFNLKYKPEYGDGVVATFAWVKDGKAYTHQAKIRRPLPPQKLQMKWTSFRNKLLPGQKEEWTLNILTPDGQPATAQLMATLYDKSLDQLVEHTWQNIPGISINLVSYAWQSLINSLRSLSNSAKINYNNVESLRFSYLSDDLKDLDGSATIMLSDTRRLYKTANVLMEVIVSSKSESAPLYDFISEEATDDAADETEMGQQPKKETTLQLRENLQETAFFYPSLATDAEGNVSLRFTLPESVTTWNFFGLAHDSQMRYAILEDEIVAKKKVMVQPNLPRFLRSADKATISAMIVNTSGAPIDGVARLELIDPETDAVVFSQETPFRMGQDQSQAVSFSYQPTEQDKLYICRIVATGKDFSDGEQHYLPILPNKEMVTNTYAISQIEPGTLEIDLNRLFAVKDNTARLTVEYTDNPVWLLIQALPTLATPPTDNAIDLSAALYANKLAQYIAKMSPKIKETIQLWQREIGPETSLTSNLEKNQELKTMVLSETPWLAEADTETEQKHQLLNLFDDNMMQDRTSSALSKLEELQQSDGSWSWWKGMQGSYYITTAVVEMLVRLEKMVGHDADTEELIIKARPFLEKKLIEDMEEMIRMERKGYKNLRPSETTVRLLYIDALSDLINSAKAKEAKQFMLKRMLKIPHEYTIYGKATAAVIFSYNKELEKAQEYMQSVQEYLVYEEEMGRYFDTHKAYYSWFDYRIPTQTHAIEAFQMLQPEKKQLISEMKRWLLQEKRTQSWSTPLNAVDAIYAFLNGQTEQLETVERLPAVIKIDGQTMPRSHPAAGLGYTKELQTGNVGDRLSIEKTADGMSFGAVYAQFLQQSTDISSSTSGLKVKREVMNGNRQLHVGDRVAVRLTIEADRDYDFVQVEDRRAACLEPVNQLSGYHWGYYIAPQDNATKYFFDRMAKGTYVIETEYFVDRVGDYTTGTCTVQCAYSPEFMGRQGALKLSVE